MKLINCYLWSIIPVAIILNSTLDAKQSVSSMTNRKHQSRSSIISDKPENEKEIDEFGRFNQSQGKIENDDVVGIKIQPNRVILFSYDGTYYIENLAEGFNFSDFNAFTKYPKLRSIQLHKISLTEEILDNLQKFAVKNIQDITVDNCKVSTKDCSDLANWIASCTKLTSISIIQPEMDGSESIPLFEAISRFKNFQFITLIFKSLLTQSAEALSRTIKNSSSILKTLVLGFLTVDDGKDYEEFLTSIKEATELEKLEYSVCESTTKHAKLFFSSLVSMTQLKDLKFYFEDFAEHDNVDAYKNAEILRDALIGMTHLVSLDISGMKLPDATIQMLSQSLSQLKTLRNLNISGNPLSVKSAESVGKAVKDLSELIAFVARDCEMSTEIFSALCNAAFSEGCGIKFLYLANNKIGESIKNLPIDKMQYLVLGDFSNNDIDYDSAIELIKKTKELSALKSLNFNGNIPILELSNLERIIKHNQLMEFQIKEAFNHKAGILGM
ncbi:MAG: hypothetical protein E7015_01260 [Alphaproteobacteria bacterium]|nr:hypothetical protein [Alphaproteobacteria bacterium]